LNSEGNMGIGTVKPGDEVVATPNIYYGYELQTNATVKVLREEFGEEIEVRDPNKAFFYEDHTALLKDERMATLRREQAGFAKPLGITVYEIDPVRGAPAICHTDMVENHALPGQLVLGNDSHTCTVGALNTLAVGKGALDLAGALAYDKMVLAVPETIRINLTGKLPDGVSMKDFMLQFGAMPQLKQGRVGSGRVFEFGGQALDEIPFDEQIKLTNMSIELLGFTGVIEPNQ
ncbi:MAG: 3-isopropylmalate dehydratase, partial [Candidatus Woesebacteria bacterium GW2011_GWB1_38_5b]